MTKWTSPSKRSPISVKRFVYGILLIFLILYFDLFRGVIQGFLLFIRSPDENTPLLAELLRNWGSFALWVLLFLFSFSTFLFLTAFFILPNLSLDQYFELWKRLWLYLAKKHGAAIFVHNGKIIGELGEKSKKGGGLLLIDRQSAVVVEELTRNRNIQVKVFAPGVVFLNPRQKIRGSVDLRPQRRSISDLRAYTKDGIEIITDLSTVFTLGQAPEVLLVTYDQEQAQNPFSVNSLQVIQLSEPSPSMQTPQTLCKMVSYLSDEIDPEDREEIHRFVQNFHLGTSDLPLKQRGWGFSQYMIDQHRIIAAFYAIPSSQPLQASMDWSDLPIQIAIDLFREFIASIPYESVYSPNRPITQSLSEIKSRFHKRIRNQGVLAFQFVQRKDNLPIRVGDEWNVADLIFYPVQSLTSTKFLRSKGIKILDATFGELRPADEMIERRLFEQWLAAYKTNLLSSPESNPAITPIAEEKHSIKQPQIANKLVEALKQPSASHQAKLSQFLAIIEAEVNNPKTRQWLSSETLQRLQNLRSQLSKTQAALPFEGKT